MTQNPPILRPDLARATVPADDRRTGQPTIGMVSLGCPKALVDSERILTRLRAEGYAISPDYAGADAVVVNTCGFLDSAKAESLEAIGEALSENGKVIVTGCLGAEPDYITGAHPRVLAVTGPQQYEQVLDAVHCAVPPAPDPFIDLLPASGVKLTPRHYSYLKISEGCNHKCKFCIIPDMRGKLVSRPAHAVIREAEKLVDAGVRELLVISQDTSAYGLDRRHETERGHRAHITDLARDLGGLGAWVRLHYVYPYPHVRDLIPLMADGLVLPYLDIPFQHAHPDTLRRMARPAAAAKTLDEIAAWRAICPEITLRSTFIVGYPGETEAEFQTLLDWLDEAQLDRVGCFQYENVAGARANDLPDHVADAVKQDRWDRFMEKAQAISEAKLAAKLGTRQQVIVDAVDAEGATCRTMADAPEIDGNLFIDDGFEALTPGDIVTVTVDEAGEYDLWGSAVITISPAWNAAGKPRKPAVLGIGAQKAGTSWLTQMLGQHPQIWVPPFKEAQYFNHRFIPGHRRWIGWHYRNKPQEIRDRHKARGVPMPRELDAYLDAITSGQMFHPQWYKRLFAPAPDDALPLDFSPEYSTLPPEGVAHVREFLPKARILYLIRHPVDRAISQLRMNLRRERRKPATLSDWLAEIENAVLAERGDYASYIPRWRAQFGDALMLIPYGRIKADPGALMADVEAHLGIGPFPYSNLTGRVFATPEGLRPPPEAVEALAARLAPQMAWLTDNLGADFAAMTC